MDDQEFEKIIELITQRTGIIPRDSHITGIKNFINKRLKELSEKEAQVYYELLCSNRDEMISLINSATVNETYFFREEAQFQLLQSKILPAIKAAAPAKTIRIWSAASSSGEEIYSLLLLAEAMNIKTECTASDINTKVLEECEAGLYKKNAVRSVDGAAFHHLLAPYRQADGSFVLPKTICSKVTRRQINLSRLADFPKNQDIVFIRNVFIYFSNEMKKQILNLIAQQSLLPGGYLFVSMNEIASIDSTILPDSLEKVADGKVFYFRKKTQAGVSL